MFVTLLAGLAGCAEDSGRPDGSGGERVDTPVGAAVADYFRQLEAFQAASFAEGESLGARLFPESDTDLRREEWEPLVKELYSEYAKLMDEWADELTELDPPASARELHDEYVDWHRGFAIELRESADELEETSSLSLEDALGGFAVGYYDFLGPTCAELQRLAGDPAIDLQCP